MSCTANHDLSGLAMGFGSLQFAVAFNCFKLAGTGCRNEGDNGIVW